MLCKHPQINRVIPTCECDWDDEELNSSDDFGVNLNESESMLKALSWEEGGASPSLLWLLLLLLLAVAVVVLSALKDDRNTGEDDGSPSASSSSSCAEGESLGQ